MTIYYLPSNPQKPPRWLRHDPTQRTLPLKGRHNISERGGGPSNPSAHSWLFSFSGTTFEVLFPLFLFCSSSCNQVLFLMRIFSTRLGQSRNFNVYAHYGQRFFLKKKQTMKWVWDFFLDFSCFSFLIHKFALQVQRAKKARKIPPVCQCFLDRNDCPTPGWFQRLFWTCADAAGSPFSTCPQLHSCHPSFIQSPWKVCTKNESFICCFPSFRIWVPWPVLSHTSGLDRAAQSHPHTPSLCVLFQSGKCHSREKCNQIHVDRQWAGTVC